MKYKKKLFISILLVSLFLVTACQSGKKVSPEKGAFIGGTQGVIANFEEFGTEDEGVFSIFNTETFPIDVTLQNKGEYELQPRDVTVKLLGPARSELQGIAAWELKNQGVVDKISELVAEGGEEVISFASDARFLTDISGFIDRQWFANIEYKYKTELIIPEVCLKEDLQDSRVCEIKEAKNFFVSGAPITVTSVEEDTSGRGIMALKIRISDVGGGDKVTMPDADFGIRNTLAFSLDDQLWECKSAGKVNEARLDSSGKAEIVCKLKNALAEGELSTKQVKLTLNYKYRDTIQETLRLRESIE